MVLSSCWLFLFLVGNAVVDHIDSFTPVVRIHTLPAHCSRSSSTIQRNSKNSAASTTTSAPPPQVLASEGDWNAYLDLQTTGLIYYFNGKTGESRWDAPSGTFPVITLTGRNKRLALQQQQVYQGLNGQQLDDDAAEKERKRQERRAARKRREAEAAAAAASELEESIAPAEEQPDWFGGLFGGTTTASSSTTTSGSTTTSTEEANWFGVADAAPASVSPKMPNFFTNMMDNFRNDVPSSSSSSAVLDMPVAESTPLSIEEVVAAPPTVRVDLVSAVLPAPSKRLWGGEDAVFCAGRVFGVFDGVTSAEKALGKPLYSKFLAAQFAALPEENWSMPRLVARLTAAAQEANVKATGATTAMVAAITDNGFLRCLNVGDSTLLVIRPFFLETLSSSTTTKEIGVRIVAKSREIIHYWECPYQLSADSPDQPAQGTKLNVELLPGDLCIMGSDGIFDNLSDRDVIKLLTSTPGFATLIRGNAAVPDASTAQRLLKTACQKICDVARQVSLDATAVTPYAKEAKLQRDPQYATGLGGKVDDISCIVARYDIT
jgi:protein phosphatase PTC7